MMKKIRFISILFTLFFYKTTLSQHNNTNSFDRPRYMLQSRSNISKEKPGGKSFEGAITGVRCLGTLSTDGPLWIIDGTIYENSQIRKVDLNPDKIESINIIRGDTAMALFGEIGSQGVIIIRTKIDSLPSLSSAKKKDSLQKKHMNIILNNNASFKIYPNPVQSGTSLNIEWKQSEEGEYILQLFNQSGQLTFNKAMWIDKDARVLNLEVPHVAAGNYFLRMTNKHSGKAFSEKIIIQ